MRRIPFTVDETYHVYNRGTEKRKIFTSVPDHKRFLALLFLANGENTVHISNEIQTSLPHLLSLDRGKPLVDICAHCLMPNHFHLMLREIRNGGISRFMQKLQTGYTMYFNTRQKRSGVLFQGKYKATHVADDRYFKYLVSYIHLNPVKLIEPTWKETGIANRRAAEKFLDGYRWSSFHDYTREKRLESRIVNAAALSEYFDSPLDFKSQVSEWLDFRVESAAP
ncbi:MAG: putative transposase [Parcubacteria group bacterium Gr01-1014_8]|nr:MAG: putative transposase [Parcubacteria group bacterium Gr01-1014_8]